MPLTAEDVRDLLGAIAEDPERLGLLWTLRPGTVVTNSDPEALSLRLDGDAVATPAIPLSGRLKIGERAFVLGTPGGGNYVLSPPAGSVLARARRTTNSTGTAGTTELPVLRLDDVPLLANNLYLITTNTVLIDVSVANDIGDVRLRYSSSGDATIASTQLVVARAMVTNTGLPESVTAAALYAPTNTESLSILLSLVRTAGTGSLILVGSATSPIDLYVVNLGVDPGNSGVDL